MNLMQIQDEIQNIPNTPEGMQLLMQYANGSNPSVVPEYIALGELSRRRQFESVAKQVAAGIPKATIKDQLTQAPAMVNPAAGIAGVNPAAPAAPVNPMMEPGNPVAAQERPYGGRTVNMADGGLAMVQEYLANRPGISSVPLNNMFNPSSYAGGGIVAFQNNPDQPVDEEMPANNTTSAQPTPRGGIGLATPLERPAMLTDDELIARDVAMRQKFGISDDPYAGAKAKQLAMEERQKEKYAQDPFDRILGSLASFAKSDPTKGMAGLGTYAEASNLINKEQTAYRDKMEAASLAFEQAMAKEEDARKRGDMQAVVAARAAQQKAQFDWQDSNIKLENAISSRVSAGASAQNAATAALRAKLEQERDPLERKKLEADIKRIESQTEANLANIPNAEQKAISAFISKDSRITNIDDALKHPERSGIRPGSESYKLHSQWLADARRIAEDALRNGRKTYILPPLPEKIPGESGGLLSRGTPPKWQYNSPFITGRGNNPPEVPAPATPPAPTGSANIPPAAVQALREDPSEQRRRQFDQIFGAGAADRILK